MVPVTLPWLIKRFWHWGLPIPGPEISLLSLPCHSPPQLEATTHCLHGAGLPTLGRVHLYVACMMLWLEWLWLKQDHWDPGSHCHQVQALYSVSLGLSFSRLANCANGFTLPEPITYNSLPKAMLRSPPFLSPD